MNNAAMLSQPMPHAHAPVPAARPVWTVESVLALFELPFADLLFRAQQTLRAHFDPNAVQRSTLLSIKTGNCSEDCGYCSQSKRHQAALDSQNLMGLDEVVSAAQAAKDQGAGRFCMGAAWRGPKDKDLGPVLDMVRAVTGWNVNLWELMKAGERSLNMMRAFNAREGFTSVEDRLPPKLFQPLTGGRSDSLAVAEEEMAAALPTYYAMCGWDAEGRPTRAKLEELGIAWVADALGS